MRRASALALTLALLVLAPSALAAPPVQEPDGFTPVTQEVVAPPWPVEGSDGRYHVTYEVRLGNALPIPYRVREILVRSASDGKVLARWKGKQVATVLQSLTDRKTTNDLPGGGGAVVHLTWSVAKRSDLPRAIVHELRLVNPEPDNGAPSPVTQLGARATLVRRAPVVLGPPLRGDRWLAADGCCTARRHVWAFQTYGGGIPTVQRFAIDWERLDAQGRLFTGDKSVLTNWAGYGSELLAVADATVVRAVDGLPQQIPGALPASITAAEADGNAVFLRLADGRVVMYAHMIPGSLRVAVGDRVTKGQVLGLLGNSGNSSAPHLHLHVSDGAAIFGANGLPYVFDAFTVTGKVASTEAFDKAEETGEPAAMGPIRTGPRADELPLDQVLVTWPG